MATNNAQVQPEVHVDAMVSADWANVSSIYLEGIATGNATFETLAPTWDEWDRMHLPYGRLVAREGRTIAGWAALSRVSQRACYAGVAELSVYVAGWARRQRPDESRGRSR
jgi:L-amino acid N-acyltransferase YncA